VKKNRARKNGQIWGKKGLRKPLFITVLIAGCVLPARMVSQEKKEPPSRPQVEEKDSVRALAEKRLPKIDLPEFIITGKERIDLSVSNKLEQESGEDIRLDASRLTTLGDKESEQFIGLSQKPGTRLYQKTEKFDGKLDLGYGRFDSKYGEGWYGRRFVGGDFSLHGNYQAHNAYVDYADASRGSFDASGGLYLPHRLALLGGSKVVGQVAYEGEKYRFFGSPTPSLERALNNFQVGISFHSASTAPFAYESSVRFRRLTVRDKDQSREDDLSLGLRASGEAAGWQFSGELNYDADFLDQSINGNDPDYLKAGGEFRKLLFENLDLSGGIDFYLYRNSDSGFKSQLYPNLLLQCYLNRLLTLFLQFEPSVQRNTLLRAVSENRYIGNDVKINHQDVYIDFAGGVQFDILSRGTGRVYFKYQRIRDFPLYVDPSTLYYLMIFPIPYADWAVRFDGITRLASLNGEILVDVTQMDRVSGTLTILSANNSFTGDQVPYLAPVMITGTYAHQFPFGLSTQFTVRFVGERRIALSGEPRLNSYSLLYASVEYAVMKYFGIFVRLNNIFDQRYSIWNRYQELPFSVLGGISVKW
jgi:hypothetical protein